MKKAQKAYISAFISHWRTTVLMGVLLALSGQFYLTLWADGFRISAQALLFPVCLILVLPECRRPVGGLCTAVCVLILRTGLKLYAGQTFFTAILCEYPGALFYLCYDYLFCLLLRDRRHSSMSQRFFVILLCDFASNCINLIFSGQALVILDVNKIMSLAGIAVFRAAAAILILWISHFYKQLLMRDEHEQRYQRLFLMTADLKTELYFLRKDVEDAEKVMTKAYRLYESLSSADKENGNDSEETHLALAIARDVHEIKKDNLRILSGLETEVDEVTDHGSMSLTDLFYLLESSTRNLLGKQQKKISLQMDYPDHVSVSEHYQLLSILKNLVTNAIEAILAADQAGTIWVNAKTEGGDLVIEVIDDGPGISSRAQSMLFNVGYSTKFDERTGNIGRGIGLPAVQYLVEELDGHMEMRSNPGEGTSFTITLPLKRIE